MRKGFRYALAGFAVAVLASYAWVWWRQPPDPVYQRKRLSFWLQQYDRHSLITRHEFESPQADEAVRAIGTNALPMLFNMLEVKDSAFTLQLIGLVQKQHLIKVNYITADRRNTEATCAFMALCSGNVPDTDTKPGIAMPDLIEFLHVPEPAVRVGAISCLAQRGTNARQATSCLLELLKDKDENVRLEVQAALFSAYPRLPWPPPSGWENVRPYPILAQVIYDLAALGTNGEPAVPALIKFLNDPDEGVRTCATNALKAIDPGAAAKAGVR